MTQNQIRYQESIESRRANQAREAETARANLAKEAEDRRSNQAREYETHRANLAAEDNRNRSLLETTAHNRATEDVGYRTYRENVRSNLANEILRGRETDVRQDANIVSYLTGMERGQAARYTADTNAASAERRNLATIKSNEAISAADRTAQQQERISDRNQRAVQAQLDRESRERIANEQNRVSSSNTNKNVLGRLAESILNSLNKTTNIKITDGRNK